MPTPTAADKGYVSENAYERAVENLHDARENIGGAVSELRELDQILPLSRRKMNAAIDDVMAELQRLQGAMQRLVERSGAAGVPVPAAGADVLTQLDGAGD